MGQKDKKGKDKDAVKKDGASTAASWKSGSTAPPALPSGNFWVYSFSKPHNANQIQRLERTNSIVAYSLAPSYSSSRKVLHRDDGWLFCPRGPPLFAHLCCAAECGCSARTFSRSSRAGTHPQGWISTGKMEK